MSEAPERWKPHPLAEFSRFEVSTWGRVRNTKTGHILALQQHKEGMSVTLASPLRQRTFMVARLIWGTFVGPLPNNQRLGYADGDRRNCGIENLFRREMSLADRHTGGRPAMKTSTHAQLWDMIMREVMPDAYSLIWKKNGEVRHLKVMD